ncbi:MAG: glycosyltransferase family 4 protein [Acidilobus sp.]
MLLIAEVDSRIGGLRRGPQLRATYPPPGVKYYAPAGPSKIYVSPPSYEKLPPFEAFKSILRQMARLVRPPVGRGFDIVHKFFFDLTRVDAPCIYESDQSIGQYLSGYLNVKTPASLQSALASLVAGNCDAVVTWSSWAAKGFVEDGFNPSRVYVIPPPVVPRTRRPHKGVNVLMVARDPVRKGVDIAIRAFKRAVRGSSDVKLIVVGPVNPLHDGGRVIVYSHVSEGLLRDYLMSSADIILAPSRAEAYNLTVLEGMAHGAVPIVSRVGGLPELVGDSGLIVSPDDYDSTADALEALIYDEALRARLSERALDLVSRRHNPEVVGEAMLKVYARVLEGRS